jgi:hypothetical protein
LVGTTKEVMMTHSKLSAQDLAELRRIKLAAKTLVKPRDVADLLKVQLDNDKLDQPMPIRTVLRMWAGDNAEKYGIAVRELGLD